jgi:electron transport complex protein RnfD
MAALFAMATWLYGLRVLILIALAVVTALLCDLIAASAAKKEYDPSDISSYMFALVFLAMLPASISYGIVIAGTAFIVLLGKHAFGGYGCYPFHPAAFGFAFASVCWPDAVYRYPASFSNIGLGWNSGAEGYTSIAGILKYGGVPAVNTVDMQLGNYPGPMGTTFIYILLASIVLFVVHRAMTWHIPVVYLATCGCWAMLFPRLPSGLLESLQTEIFSGAIVFAAAFIVAEPTTSPVNPRAKVIYGALMGVGTMFFRTYGVYEMGVCFAIILLNPLSSYLDRRLALKAFKKGAKI